MARFSYKGRERNGALTEGELDANDAGSAAAMLRARSVTPIAIVPMSDKKRKCRVWLARLVCPRSHFGRFSYFFVAKCSR